MPHIIITVALSLTPVFAQNLAIIAGGGCDEIPNAFKSEMVRQSTALSKRGWDVSVHYDGTQDPIDPKSAKKTKARWGDATNKSFFETLEDAYKQAEAGTLDQLLLQIDTHGGQTPHVMCMQGKDEITPEMLRPYLQKIADKGVRIAVIDDSCYSGGSVDSFENEKWCTISNTQDTDYGLFHALSQYIYEEMGSGKKPAKRDLESAYLRQLAELPRQVIPELSPFRGPLEQKFAKLRISITNAYAVVRYTGPEPVSAMTSATKSTIDERCKTIDALKEGFGAVLSELPALQNALKKRNLEKKLRYSVDSINATLTKAYSEMEKLTFDAQVLGMELAKCYSELESLQKSVTEKGDTKNLVYGHWLALRANFDPKSVSNSEIALFRTLDESEKSNFLGIKSGCLTKDQKYERLMMKVDDFERVFFENAHKLQAYAYLLSATDDDGNSKPNPCNQFDLYPKPKTKKKATKAAKK